jgi:pre-mRNA-splicing factor ATP-dependent RNA helicase DHX38/PRP16
MIGARGAGGEKENVEGMDHDRSDVLAAEPRRKGGLTRSDNVSHA